MSTAPGASGQAKGSGTGWLRLLRPVLLSVGTFLLFCAVFGRWAAKTDKFDHFDRFVYFIQPQWQFYPNVSEVANTVESIAPKDKILVLVGGNSIFRGTGQSIERLWTKSLQTELGGDYAVVNVAIDQSQMEAFSGVVFRALYSRYPKRIYVGTIAEGFHPFSGLGIYEYVYWDAFYKGLLDVDDGEYQAASRARLQELKTIHGISMHLYAILDSIFYFSSVKNFIAYRIISPDWSSPASEPFRRRSWYVEQPTPDLSTAQSKTARDKSWDKFVTGRFSDFIPTMVNTSSGPIKLKAAVAKDVAASFDTIFPKRERKRIIGVIMRPNAHYLRLLAPNMQKSMDAIHRDVLDLFRSKGYNGIIVGEHLDDADFFDQGHLMASGGYKLALEIAAEVRNVAKEEGYAAATK